jgi:hypothetical protein
VDVTAARQEICGQRFDKLIVRSRSVCDVGLPEWLGYDLRRIAVASRFPAEETKTGPNAVASIAEIAELKCSDSAGRGLYRSTVKLK